MRQPGFGVKVLSYQGSNFGQNANDAFAKGEQIKFPFANMAMQINQKMKRNLDRSSVYREKSRRTAGHNGGRCLSL